MRTKHDFVTIIPAQTKVIVDQLSCRQKLAGT